MQPGDRLLDEKVKDISEKLQLSEKTVCDFIEISKSFKYSESISDENKFVNERCVSFLPESNTSSKINTELIQSEIQKLSPIEKRLLELTGGVGFDSLEETDKKTYQQTALLLGLTESAIEKKRKRILKKLKSALDMK